MSVYIVAVTLAKEHVRQSAKRGARISGIVASASDLGVSRQHLWAVLTKRRESKPLLGRYRAWRAARVNSPKTTTHPTS